VKKVFKSIFELKIILLHLRRFTKAKSWSGSSAG